MISKMSTKDNEQTRRSERNDKTTYKIPGQGKEEEARKKRAQYEYEKRMKISIYPGDVGEAVERISKPQMAQTKPCNKSRVLREASPISKGAGRLRSLSEVARTH